jgi:hypothetical protein
MAALAALDGKVPFEELHPKAYEAMRELPFAWSAVRQGLIGPALRGIWGSARMGKMLLPRYKEMFAEATTLFRVVESAFSLAAIGLRHSRLAAEVEKTLASPLPPTVGGELYQKLLNLIVEEVTLIYKATRTRRDLLLPTHLKLGRSIIMQLGANAKPGSRFKFTRNEDVPDDLAYALPFNTPLEFAGKWKNVQFMSLVLPWLATAEAEQLYLPAEYLSEVIRPYEDGEIMPLLLALRDDERQSPGPTRSTPKGSARNEPCPCGSGKKYKRCCAGKSAMVEVEKAEDDDTKAGDWS